MFKNSSTKRARSYVPSTAGESLEKSKILVQKHEDIQSKLFSGKSRRNNDTSIGDVLRYPRSSQRSFLSIGTRDEVLNVLTSPTDGHGSLNYLCAPEL